MKELADFDAFWWQYLIYLNKIVIGSLAEKSNIRSMAWAAYKLYKKPGCYEHGMNYWYDMSFHMRDSFRLKMMKM